MKRRVIYGICFAIVLLIEIGIGVYVRDSFVRPYVGDVLVVVLIYCFARIFIPRRVPQLPIYVFGFATFIEVLQYFRLNEVLEIQNKLLRIMIGSTFDWKDILCYSIGCLCIILVEKGLRRSKGDTR